MIEPNKIAIRRILVVLDASPHGLAALEAAARLAAELRVDLQGLFVEDVNLLRSTCLPFVREIAYSSASRRQLDPSATERTLRARAERVRDALASTCHRQSVQWSFSITRGHVTRSALRAAAESDLLIMGREGLPLTLPPTVKAVGQRGPIVVIYDGSSAAKKAMETANRLASGQTDEVVVVLSAAEGVKPGELRRECSDCLQSMGIAASIVRGLITDSLSLVRVAREWRATALLINQANTFLDEAVIDFLVHQLDCPVVLVR